MEKRYIKITFEQASEWYNSNNATLKTLALSAYSEDELKYNNKSIEDIEKQMHPQMMIGHFNIVQSNYQRLKALIILNTLATYFNGNCWKKTPDNTGYFIEYNEVENVIDICEHHGEGIYSGIVYFRNKEDAKKAMNILGKRVNDLF